MTDNFKYVQSQNFSLAGSGVVIGATSVVLKSMNGIDGTALTMTDFGALGFGTIEPGNSTLEEQICFTGLTTNANGTVTLSGVSNVLFIAPYTQTSGVLKTHAGSTTFVISNTSGFYDSLSGKADDETITGVWTFPSADPTRAGIGSDTDTTTATAFVTLGQLSRQAIAGAAKATNTVYGISKLSVAAASGTVPIAIGDNDTRVPTQNENDALVGVSGTATSSSNKLEDNADTSATSANGKLVRANGSGKIDNGFLIAVAVPATDIQVFTTSGANTWTKPAGAKMVFIEAWGGGGGSGGVSNTSTVSGGGGGGGYFYRWIPASLLGATETATVGTGGTAGTTGGGTGGTGGNSTFGSWLTAVGGVGSVPNTGTPAGGVGGGTGTVWKGGAAATAGDYGGAGGQAADANSATTLGAAAGSVYGGGAGGGGSLVGTGGTGGTSTFEGGTGGNGGTNTIGTVGSQPGGGAGGSGTNAGGNKVGLKGGDGQAIITTFF